MNYENYRELYEAVYIFDKTIKPLKIYPLTIEENLLASIGINTCIYKAVMRILLSNNLAHLKDDYYLVEDNHKKEHDKVLGIIEANRSHYECFHEKALKDHHFFFDHLSEIEYEIYARYNFQLTYATGIQVKNHLNLANQSIIELGGNSGGLAASMLKSFDCDYTVVDTSIPCMIGREFNQVHETTTIFVDQDIFKLDLGSKKYDHIVMMNLLHDFDDIDALKIIEKTLVHGHEETQISIIEDVLFNDHEPKEVLMHGLRLAVECRGGRQRTISEFEVLLNKFRYQLQSYVVLNKEQSLLTFRSCYEDT